MSEKSGIEQRKHIRVNDYAVFKYYEPGADLKISERALAKTFFSESNGRYYFLCKEFKEIDDALKLSKAQQPLYDALDRKTNLLKEAMYPSVMDSRQVVNISDGGVGFNGNFEVHTHDAWGYVMFILDNWPVPLFIRGQFVYCVKTKDQAHNYKIGFKFEQSALDCADIIKEQVEIKLAEKADRPE